MRVTWFTGPHDGAVFEVPDDRTAVHYETHDRADDGEIITTVHHVDLELTANGWIARWEE